MITHRGNSMWDKGQVVHLKVPAKRDGTREAYPLCGNGAHHLTWTDKEKQVTCPACFHKLVVAAQAKRS